MTTTLLAAAIVVSAVSLVLLHERRLEPALIRIGDGILRILRMFRHVS